MLSKLRLRLTLLYLAFAMALILLSGGGAYSLMRYYFQYSTDLALKYRMVQELHATGMDVPAELQDVEQDWQTSYKPVLQLPKPVQSGNDGEEDDDHLSHDSSDHNAPDEAYDSNLAAVFIYQVSQDGQSVGSINSGLSPIPPDPQAAQAALANGSDLRTVTLPDSSTVRLLTVSAGHDSQTLLLQAGRLTGDQESLLRRFLTGLLALGSISLVLLGLGSWWLAGRAMQPTQRAWEQQQAFVANASHELRAPLTLMRASIEVAQRSSAAGEASSLLEDALQDIDYMNRLLEDLLLLSRLDHQRLKLNQEIMDLPGLLADILRQVERLAKAQGVELLLDTAPCLMTGDEARLKQVVLILLDNALQNTPAGGRITLSARQQAGQVRIAISDTGRGIPAEHLPHVFERFYKGSPSSASDSRGHGLGLSIARGLVAAHGGHITIESQVGQGTRVLIILPAGQPTQQFLSKIS